MQRLERPQVRGRMRRAGITLLEVLLALAIFAGAAAAIGQLWQVATQAALKNQFVTEATIRCETLLNEVVAGAVPAETQDWQAFADDPAWQWSVLVEPAEWDYLEVITVTVEYTAADATGPIQVTLSRRRAVPPEPVAEESTGTAESSP